MLSLIFTVNSSPQGVRAQGYEALHVVSHTVPLDVVFVGYVRESIDTVALDSGITKYYTMPYADWTFSYHFAISYVFANQTYLQDLGACILDHSVNGTDTTSKLNVTALEYQRATGTKMSIFLPQSGRAIDAVAVEDWFATHPYVSSVARRYTFYVLNFTNFDTPDHSLEHWYNLTEQEFDANTTRDFWRLEWDNALNPDVHFPYAAFSYRHPLFFIDPSAFNWYLAWARIWWQFSSNIAGDPKSDYYFEDLDTFQQTHDVSLPAGKTALGYYLSGWIDDILSNNLAPSVWSQPTYSLSLQVLVLNNESSQGYPSGEMKWILNTSRVKEAVEQLAPFISVDVSVKFANLTDYPDVNALLQGSITRVQDGWTYIDGYNLFYGLENVRSQHFNYNKAEWVVNGYVFLLKNASMIFGSNEYTGLGGDRQVLILKSVDRYFKEDGVTPKSGLTMVMTHELGHNLGFPHSFANYGYYYAGDFAFDVMGYYPYAFYFDRLKTDLYRRAYTDVSYADLQNALTMDHQLYSAQNQSILIDRLFAEIDNRVAVASLMFDALDYSDALYKVLEAQRIEAYLKELLTGIIRFGDANHDGIVNITDVAKIGAAWQSRQGTVNYDFYADLNHDNITDIKDAAIIGANWQKTGKVKAGFLRWAAGNRTTTFDYVAGIYAGYTTVEKNATYGYWNWGNSALQCSLRINNITDTANLADFFIKIYNATATLVQINWSAGDPLPQNWTPFTVAPHSEYFVQVGFTGTFSPPTLWSRITIEAKVNSP